MRRRFSIPVLCTSFVCSVVVRGGTIGFSIQNDSAQIGAFSTGAGGAWNRGGAVGDLNRDGFQDIFLSKRGTVDNQLWINDGDGTFTNQIAASGIPSAEFCITATIADYDRDGFPDIYMSSRVANSITHDALFRNNGDLTFTDVSVAAGIRISESPSGRVTSWASAWGDYDLDGDLDLALSRHETGSPSGNLLFRNNGDGTFTNVSQSAGVAPLLAQTHGFSVRFVDMNNDRYPELIWIGDFTTSRYFVNNGDGTFTDYTVPSGINRSPTEMGMTVGDYNFDGFLDLYVTYIGKGNMYLNQGSHVFNLAPQTTSEHPTIWGWGTVSIDFDHDSRVDIVTTAQGTGASAGQTAIRNDSTAESVYFTNVTTQATVDSNQDGRGLANLDYDNDGDQDLIVIPGTGPLTLYRNDLSGSNINWLRVFLDATGAADIPPDGIGSVVKIRLGETWRIGRIDGGNNYMSQSETSAHFGLGGATVIDELRVEWTNGAVTSLYDIPANQMITIASCPEHCMPSCPGDINCDGASNGRDIDAFLSAMLAPDDFSSLYPGCDLARADMNLDSAIDMIDAQMLASALLNH